MISVRRKDGLNFFLPTAHRWKEEIDEVNGNLYLFLDEQGNVLRTERVKNVYSIRFGESFNSPE